MQGWVRDLGALLLVWICVQALLGAVLGGPLTWEGRAWRTAARLVRRVRRRGRDAEVVPLHRPIEQIGADVRRLHEAFHRGGMRFAKWEGCRQAYDGVLAEAAEMLEIDHLLSVLPPGDERDHERDRIEAALARAGLLPRRHAA